MVGLLDLCASGKSNVTGAKRRGVFGDLRLSHFLLSREEESKCRWCVVLSFTPLSVSVSLSLSLSWSSDLRTVICLLLICPCCGEICLLNHFSLLIRLGFLWVFFHKDERLAEKLLLIIFIFWQLSSSFHYTLILCTENPFFRFQRKSQPQYHPVNALVHASLVGLVCLFLWHINLCRLFNAKSIFM